MMVKSLWAVDIIKLLCDKIGINSILDVGCGEGGVLNFLEGIPKRVGVDIWAPAIIRAQVRYPGICFAQWDITDLRRLFPEDKFEAVIGLDIIEHLESDQVHNVISQIEFLATKLVVLFGPLEDVHSPIAEDGNPYMAHKNILNKTLFQELGYELIIIPNYWDQIQLSCEAFIAYKLVKND